MLDIAGPSQWDIQDMPETPGPIRARVNNLHNQVTELVRKEHANSRKHRSEVSALESTLAEVRATLAATQKELARCKVEGNDMRDELNAHSLVQQQKAVLALAEEQMRVVEMEHRLQLADQARIMRDHKLALFKAREDDLALQLADRDAQLEELEASLSQANTSLAHQRAADRKTNTESSVLQSKVDKLEATVLALREREKEARSELDGWLRDEKSKDHSTDKEKRELQLALKSTKAELARKTEELQDVQEELASLKETSRDRERGLKAKLKEAQEEPRRLASIEIDLETAKAQAGTARAEAQRAKAALRAASESVPPEEAPSAAKRASPRKVPAKSKVRKASPLAESESEEPIPKKQSRKAAPIAEPTSDSDSEVIAKTTKKAEKLAAAKKTKAPLAEASSTVNNGKRRSASPVKKGTSTIEKIPESEATLVEVPEKKKKRKLLGAPSTFAWDPIMNSGDGVIPLTLSPVVTTAGKGGKVGTIPRLGFPSAPSSRTLARF